MANARNPVADTILQAIQHGKLPPAQTEARLYALIEQETSRTDAPADVALIDGCLLLLEHLHAPSEVPDKPQSALRRIAGACRWIAAAAAVLLLVLGLTGNLHWQWFEHSASPDGEQHVITGHELKVDVIQQAIADHQDFEQILRYDSVAKMERDLGFNPGIPAVLGDGWIADSLSVHFTPEQITFTVAYHNAACPESSIDLTVQCYVDADEVPAIIETTDVVEIVSIGGCDVFIARTDAHSAAQWMNGCTSYALRVPTAASSIREYIREIVSGTPVSVSSARITASDVEACINRNLLNYGLETADFGELCDYLGFTPDIIRPESLGADSAFFNAGVTRAYIYFDAQYVSAEGKKIATFSATCFTSIEDVFYTFEQSEEGEFIRIGEQNIYSAMNINRPVFCWTDDTVVYTFYWGQATDASPGVAALEDYFAGHVITRETPPSLPDITAAEIQACIERNQTQQLFTSDFGEVCDFLGFTPQLLHPDAIGAVCTDFTLMTIPDNIRLTASYCDANDTELGMFSLMYFANQEDAYFTFEQNQEGEFLRIGQQQVYSAMNITCPVFAWTDGAIVYTFYWNHDVDSGEAALADFFSGHVLTRENAPGVHPSAAEEYLNALQSSRKELQHLRTSDHARICEFLGFTPELIRPEMLGATGIDFIAEVTPGDIRVDAFYLNAEGVARNQLSLYYRDDPDTIPYRVEENETGHFIDVHGVEVYASTSTGQLTYSWRFENGVGVLYCDPDSDLCYAALEDYLAGHHMTTEAAAALPTAVTEQQVADAILRQSQQNLTTDDFGELCEFLDFTPTLLRPEALGVMEALYSATVFPDWIVLSISYQTGAPTGNILLHIQYFSSVDELAFGFEQSETGVFLSIAGRQIYCAPNLYRTTYAWTDGAVAYSLSGVLPRETTLPILEAYFSGDTLTAQ